MDSLTVNGIWGTWGRYGSCSKPCNGGVQERFRHCNKPAPAYGGKGCPGSAKTVRSCNTHKCPGKFLYFIFPVFYFKYTSQFPIFYTIMNFRNAPKSPLFIEILFDSPLKRTKYKADSYIRRKDVLGRIKGKINDSIFHFSERCLEFLGRLRSLQQTLRGWSSITLQKL